MTHTPSQMPDEYTPASCGGERCSMCGKPAQRKVEENIFYDDPQPMRHPLTAYVCLDHFKQIMDRGGYRAAVSDAPTGDLVLCRRVVKPSEHEGDTGYEYFEPVQDYVPSDKDAADIVDKAYIFLCNKLNDYQAQDSSRPASFYTDLKPSMLWAVEYLAKEGYIKNAPDQSEVIKALVEELNLIQQNCEASASSHEERIKTIHGITVRALADKAGGA